MATYYVRSAGGNDFSGTAITDGAYTYTTNVLSKTGIGTGLTAGMKIAISGGTNMTPGLYKLATVGADSVTFAASPKAGTADSGDSNVTVPSNNGTSFATGFATIFKAAAVATTADDEVRICADADHDLAGITITMPASNGTPSARIKFFGANATGTVDGTKAVVKSTDVHLFTCGTTCPHLHFRYLTLQPTAAAARGGIVSAYRSLIEDCTGGSFGDNGSSVIRSCALCVVRRCSCTDTRGILVSAAATSSIIEDCFASGLTSGYTVSSYRQGVIFRRCRAASCTAGWLLTMTADPASGVVLDQCIANACTSGISWSGGGLVNVSHCVLDANGTGINCTAGDIGGLYVTNSVIQHSTSSGITLPTLNAAAFAYVEEYNTFYSNAADVTGGTINATSTTGTDPGLIRTGGDFGHDGDTVLTEVETAFGDGVNKTYLYAGAVQPKTITPAEVAAAAWSNTNSPSRTLTA